jgi:hypothetical protein
MADTNVGDSRRRRDLALHDALPLGQQDLRFVGIEAVAVTSCHLMSQTSPGGRAEAGQLRRLGSTPASCLRG